MSNFRFIKTGINTQPFLEELEQNKDLWGMVSQMSNIGGIQNPYGFLPLTMGIQYGAVDIKDSEHQGDTPARILFPRLNAWLRENKVNNHSRAAFFRLLPGHSVGLHIDEGKYYLTRDRYHFSLAGRYRYEVDGEAHVIEPGTFFWFDNKKPHTALNIGEVDRVTFVFDVPKGISNP